MVKFIFTLILFFIIFLSLFFIIFYFSFNLVNSNNFINKKFRYSFTENLNLRQLFKLSQIGDARGDYLTNNNFSQLNITIFSPFRDTFSSEFKNILIDRIKQIVNKPSGIYLEEKSLNLNLRSDLNDSDLANIIKNHPIKLKDSAQLQIFLLESYQPHPSNIGLVKDAYHIFLFSKPLEDISHFEKTSDNAYLSTILHEFAHLLGAGHVANDRCILSEKVEDIAFGRPAEITTNFCPEDLEEIYKSSSAF